MMKKILIIVFNLIISLRVINAQTSNTNYSLPNIIPPSQETFNLSKVSFNTSDTGEFNYQFPFSEISGIPVKLSYNSGIKVDDIGGSIGMSWQLNAGGVISRVVRDEPDEKSVSSWFPEIINENQDLEMIKAAAHPDNSIDTEYDWFNFSVSNGFSGSFYIDRSLNVYNHDSESSKIEIIDKNVAIPGYGKTLEFIITDKQGNKYFFGGSLNFIEKTEFEKEGPDQMAVTGWYLSKILFSNNKSINFEYDMQNLNYLASYNTNISLTEQCSSGGLAYDFSGPNISTMTMKSAKPVLKSIEDDKTKVSFLYEKLRQDVYGSINSPKLLTKLSIYDKSEIVNLKEYILQYDDYQKSHSSSGQNMSPNNDLTTTYRYFLKNIQEIKSNQNYQFEYISPSEFPPRFSLKKDLYGYYNGKNNYSAFPKVTSNMGEIYILANQYFSGIATADKSIDPTYSVIGNLKKIQYPTGGYTEIGYSNNVNAWNDIVQKYIQSEKILFAERENCKGSPRDGTSFFSFISNGEPIEYSANIPYIDTATCNSETDFHDQHSIVIIDVTENSKIVMHNTVDADKMLHTFRSGIDSGYCYEYGSPIRTPLYCPVKTKTGHEYKVTYTVTSALSKIMGDINVHYNGFYTDVQVTYTQNLPGNPVEYVTDVNNVNEKYTKKYYYTYLDKINTGNIIVNNATSSISYEKIEFDRDCGSPYIPGPAILYRFNNEILSLYFNNRQNKMYYPIITEVIEGKEATVKHYTYSSDLSPNHIKFPAIIGLPRSNFGNVRRSHLKTVTDYKFTGFLFEKIRTTSYNYNYNTNELNNYVFRQNYTLLPGPVSQTNPIKNISYSEYYNYYGFSRLDSSISTDYQNGVPLQTTTEYFYSNPNHYQLTDLRTEFPDLSQQLVHYDYAHEKGKTDLIAANMIGIPLETTVTKKKSQSDPNPKITSKNGVEYVKKTINGKDIIVPDYALSYNLDPPYSSSIDVKYDQYDNNGNLLQYTLKPDANGNGVPVTIIWGYNQTQPIAKIEGAKLSDVSSSLITSIVNASNTDAAAAANNDESALLGVMNTFRKLLPNYMVTTYTYDPLIGVRSITPPSGITEFYKYDTAGRLEFVKDINGNLLKENKYHYKQP